MHMQEPKQKLIAAAFIRAKDPENSSLASDLTITFRPGCDCPQCMEAYIRAFLLMCLQASTQHELDFEAILEEAKESAASPSYLQ